MIIPSMITFHRSESRMYTRLVPTTHKRAEGLPVLSSVCFELATSWYLKNLDAIQDGYKRLIWPFNSYQSHYRRAPVQAH